PGWVQSLQTAIGNINGTEKALSTVPQSPGVVNVMTPTKAAVDAATGARNDSSKLNASSTAADLSAAKVAVAKHVADAAKGAADAAKALEAMQAAPAADLQAAGAVAKVAQDASKAAQDVQSALLTAAPGAPGGGSASAQFGLIELRGRTLSQDGTVKLSIGNDAHGYAALAFNQLQPSPKREKQLQKPRGVERDR